MLDFHRIYGLKTVVFRHSSMYGFMQQSLSLLELFSLLEKTLNIKMKYEKFSPRASDQKVFVADISKIKSKIAWQPKVSAQEGILEMISWVNSVK